jgi:D-alanyl-lipoteichoic acid acyltransferase DltB (MBOAT superfamily)
VISFQSGKIIYHASTPLRKKIVLALAVICLLIPLGFFKYYNFGIELFHQIPLPLNYSLNLPFIEFILPIGISFFTFSAISYVADIYRGTILPEQNFIGMPSLCPTSHTYWQDQLLEQASSFRN